MPDLNSFDLEGGDEAGEGHRPVDGRRRRLSFQEVRQANSLPIPLARSVSMLEERLASTDNAAAAIADLNALASGRSSANATD